MKNFIDGIFFNENSKLMKSIIIEYVKILKVFDIVDHNKSNFFKIWIEKNNNVQIADYLKLDVFKISIVK